MSLVCVSGADLRKHRDAFSSGIAPSPRDGGLLQGGNFRNSGFDLLGTGCIRIWSCRSGVFVGMMFGGIGCCSGRLLGAAKKREGKVSCATHETRKFGRGSRTELKRRGSKIN